MYVCSCNGITERQVKAAIEQGAKNWSDVHAFYGREPQCGSCGYEISKIINPSITKTSPNLPHSNLIKA